MRITALLAALVLSGCGPTPVIYVAEKEVIVTCVLSNCTRLIEALRTDNQRVMVTCVLAKCQPPKPPPP